MPATIVTLATADAVTANNNNHANNAGNAAPKAERVVLPFYSADAFPALRIYTWPQLPSLVAADIGIVGNVFYIRTTRCNMLCGVATMELSNLISTADVDADDLHICSYTYHPEDYSATIVISAYAGCARIQLRAHHMPASMVAPEGRAIEDRAAARR
jgi:hypothetical protein